MFNYLSKAHRMFLSASFILIVIGYLLCINFFFVSGHGADEIVANIGLLLAFSATLWYMVSGHKKASEKALYVPLFMYSLCVIIMISTSTISLPRATPFITGSTCTMIIYPIVIAFNQKNVRLCTIMFAIMIFAEVAHSCFIFFFFAPQGVSVGGSITATLNNIHIFVRTFMTSALALCYGARYLRNRQH